MARIANSERAFRIENSFTPTRRAVIEVSRVTIPTPLLSILDDLLATVGGATRGTQPTVIIFVVNEATAV